MDPESMSPAVLAAIRARLLEEGLQSPGSLPGTLERTEVPKPAFDPPTRSAAVSATAAIPSQGSVDQLVAAAGALPPPPAIAFIEKSFKRSLPDTAALQRALVGGFISPDEHRLMMKLAGQKAGSAGD